MQLSPKFRIRRFGRRTIGALTPAQMAEVYQLPQVKTTRQPVIGIVELGGGYKDSDNAAAFADMSQSVPPISSVSIGGARNAPGDAADGEVALDIQVAGGVCQAMAGPCKIVIAWAPNNGGTAFAAAIDALVVAGVDSISISWGGPETEWTPAERAAVAAAIDRANAAGRPVFAASGDADSGDGLAGNNVDFPASYPGTIGCGGTTLTIRATANGAILGYGAETVWNDGRGDGTGGGYSRYYVHTVWQSGANSMRGVPDVCGPADPAGPGWRIVLNGAVQAIGGTSAVAPFWAGIVAACKAAGYDGKKLAQFLYANPKAMRDTIKGNNGDFAAGPGWDPCTGLGSPNGPELVRLLLSQGSGSGTPPTIAPPATPTAPPAAPPVPTLAQAQAAAVQGVEDAATAHPILAAIIQMSEPSVKSRLAALWESELDRQAWSEIISAAPPWWDISAVPPWWDIICTVPPPAKDFKPTKCINLPERDGRLKTCPTKAGDASMPVEQRATLQQVLTTIQQYLPLILEVLTLVGQLKIAPPATTGQAPADPPKAA